MWGRLDIFVALFLVLGLERLGRDRVAQAAVCISAAALLKLWPAVLLVLLLPVIERRHRRVWLTTFLGLPTALVGAVLASGGGHGLATMLRFQGHRGLEVEAVAAVPVHWWIFAGHAVSVVHAHGSMEFPVDSAAPLLVGCEALLAVSLTAILWVTARNHPAASIVMLQTCTAILVFGNVLSPQYFIWTAAGLAFWADEGLAAGRKTTLWVGMSMLLATQYVFPLFFSDIVSDAPTAVILLTVRTALLLWFAARIARLSSRIASPGPAGRGVLVAIDGGPAATQFDGRPFVCGRAPSAQERAVVHAVLGAAVIRATTRGG